MNRRQVLASSLGFFALAGCVERRTATGPYGGNSTTTKSTPAPVRQTATAGPLSIQWVREYGPEGGETVYTPNGSPAIRSFSLVRTADGGYALTGHESEGGMGRTAYLLSTDASGNRNWFREYGGEMVNTETPVSDDDPGGGGSEANCVTLTTDGGYLLAGEQTSPTEGVSDTGWVLKADASGNPEWYGWSDEDTESVFEDAVETDAGNYAFTGWIKGQDGTSGWFVKRGPDGERLVTETYDTGPDDPASIAEEFESIVETSDGGFVLAGEYVEGGWVLKVDDEGTKQWETFLDTPPYLKANDVIETSDGNYLVTGRVLKGDQNPRRTAIGEKNASDLGLTLVDQSGTVQWTNTYDGGENEFGMAVVSTADGGYAAVGGSTRQRHEKGVFVVKTDGEGNAEWSETYLVEQSVEGRDLVQATDGGFAITAGTIVLKLGPD